MTRIKITTRCPKDLKLNDVHHGARELTLASDSDDSETASHDSAINYESVHMMNFYIQVPHTYGNLRLCSPHTNTHPSSQILKSLT